jgi:hypothetical protein
MTSTNMHGYILSKRNLICSNHSRASKLLLKGSLIKKILAMQTDWGGEYEKLNPFFKKIGIAHHVPCPHAHQQNSSAEKKHRHIIEIGLALLAKASMPLKFWDEAFATTARLINVLTLWVI